MKQSGNTHSTNSKRCKGRRAVRGRVGEKICMCGTSRVFFTLLINIVYVLSLNEQEGESVGKDLVQGLSIVPYFPSTIFNPPVLGQNVTLSVKPQKQPIFLSGDKHN